LETASIFSHLLNFCNKNYSKDIIKKVVLVENGVDISAFNKDNFVFPLDIDSIPRPRLGFIGTMNPRKN
jgi:hypothetical protein